MTSAARHTILFIAVAIPWAFSFSAHAQQGPSISAVHAGFAGNYKLGCWTPLEVEITGGAEPLAVQVRVTVPDGDDVPTTVMTPLDHPVSLQADRTQKVYLFIRVGQRYGSLTVQLVDEQRNVVATRVFHPADAPSETMFSSGLPTTNRLIVEFGSPVGLAELIQREEQNEIVQSHIARIDNAADLPSQWYGYEGVDSVVLTTSQADLYYLLAQDPTRIRALRRWVELGGKLVIFCGANADELLVEGGALAELSPGTYSESITVEQSQSIEAFSGAEQSITPTRRVDFRVPMFTDIRGKVLASARRGETEVPLVIRSYLGFGELTFVGLDFDRPPLVEWPGRQGFLSKALALAAQAETHQQRAGTIEMTSDDMITQVRNTLDGSFVGVKVVPFALVAVLVVGYILLIGPGDYYLVNKVFKRPEITWISFPLFVVGVSAAAYWFANWQKGDQLRVNQVEFIDVDANSRLTRGTVWTHFFTPHVHQFDLSVQPAFLGKPSESDERLVAWLGLPGYTLGGMQTGGGQMGLFDHGYTFDAPLEKMVGVPVQLWSTKTITARWTGVAAAPVSATLNRTDDQLVLGQIVNQSEQSFEGCVLLYGQWAWNLGTLAGGAALSMADAAQPRTVRTLLTNATAGDTTITETADDGTVPFRLANSDMTRLAKVIMFYDAINGGRYSGMLSRYQGFLDMSHLLDQPDLAILLARTKTSGSQWLDAERPLASNQDVAWTYYRFVIPVGSLLIE